MSAVAVTGIGIVSPLGLGSKHVWQQLITGKSGIRQLGAEYTNLPVQIGGTPPLGSKSHEWDPHKFLNSKNVRNMPKFCQYAIGAASMALKDADYPTPPNNSIRIGTAIGSGIGGLESIYTNSVNFSKHGYRKVSPHFVPSLLPNMAAGHISIHSGVRGPNHSVSTACTTGAHSIGDAFNMIQLGMADVMIAGSAEAAVHPISVAGFARARSLTTDFNTCPELASRPFDARRSGFVISEGACVLILEKLDHAVNRNARILALLSSYGLSSDAHHITAPHESGDGAYRCMQMALNRANLGPKDVGYINAHATSTSIGDKVEANAINKLFKESSAAVSSTKGSTGHLLGASGSLEAAFTVLSLYYQTLPPTLNLENPLTDLDFVKETRKVNNLNHALTNSFGFGGTNASLLFSKYNYQPSGQPSGQPSEQPSEQHMK